MGFLDNAFGSLVKVVLTPVAIVKDVVNVATGEDVDATKNLVEGAVDDAGNSLNDLANGDL